MLLRSATSVVSHNAIVPVALVFALVGFPGNLEVSRRVAALAIGSVVEREVRGIFGRAPVTAHLPAGGKTQEE